MTIYDAQLNEVLKNYEYLYEMFKSELAAKPEGKLLYQNNGSYKQFLQLTNENGKNVRRGINRDEQKIRALASKEFCSRAMPILENNISALRKAIARQIPFDPGSSLESLTKSYAMLPEEYFFDRDKLVISAGLDEELIDKIKRHEAWWKTPYTEYWGYPERKTKTTSRGQKVRSISELLIAEALYKYSIPFHYEEELKIGEKTFAPDFTFEDAGYTKFYLDYFGMMSDPVYARRNFNKLREYHDFGLVPGDNLIVAFDSCGIMNAGVIEGLINNEIIPRL